MDQIKLKSVEPLKEGSSRFVVPLRMTYEQNGIEKTWDMVQSHDSVGAVIFNKSTEKFVFVRQFRPPVYRHSLQNSGKDLKGYCGICFELCMGIVDDKSLSLEETTRKEILEETGFKASSLERIGSWISSVGLTGGHTTLFYTEVSEADRVSKGGGRSDEGELIEGSGCCLELCEGIHDDPSLSLEETVRKEIFEETGYSSSGALELIGSWLENSPELYGSRRTIYYTEVSSEDKLGPGGGCSEEGELIEVLELSLDELKGVMDSPFTSSNLGADMSIGLAYYWFLAHKSHKC